MKVYLSLHNTKEYKIEPCLIASMAVFCVVHVCYENFLENGFRLSVLFGALALGVIFFSMVTALFRATIRKEYLLYMIFSDELIDQYSHKNVLMHRVNMRYPVYYMIIDALDDNRIDHAKIIVISNEKAPIYSAVAKHDNDIFFDKCDFNGYIAMYYNESTEPYLKLNEWEQA